MFKSYSLLFVQGLLFAILGDQMQFQGLKQIICIQSKQITPCSISGQGFHSFSVTLTLCIAITKKEKKGKKQE